MKSWISTKPSRQTTTRKKRKKSATRTRPTAAPRSTTPRGPATTRSKAPASPTATAPTAPIPAGVRRGGIGRTVAALYVDRERGPYAKYSFVDVWDWARDARRYVGPNPVVAHPACGPWGRFYWNYGGGEGDFDCGLFAVDQVRRYGGVLEHPSESGLWYNRPAKQGKRGRPGVETLPRPSDCEPPKPGKRARGKRRKCPDDWGGHAIEVNQVDWGHKAKKPTWLYIVGVPRERLPPFPARRSPTHLMVGFRKGPKNPRGLPEVPKRERHLTPPDFAAWLLQIAAQVEMP